MTQRRRIPLSSLNAEAHVCTPAVRLHMLGRVPLFAGLNPHELAQVDRRCRAHGFEAGSTIYRVGDAATTLYVVATGAAKTIRPGEDGRETLLDLCGPGDFLGAVPALGEEFYPDWAWALTPSCLLGIDAAAYTEIMEEFPAVAMATLKGVSRRLSESQRAVHLLAGAPLEQRLAATLLLLAEKVGRPWEGGTLLDVPLSREDLAAMAGAATESVSRLLSRWRRQGLVDAGRRWIAVQDGPGLEALRDR